MNTPAQKRPLWEIVFLSKSERRLRAGWRLLLQTITLGVFLCVVAFPVLWFGPGKSQTWLMLFSTLAECFAITVSIIYARRFLDRRTFVSLGLAPGKQAVWDVAAGLGISFVVMALILLIGTEQNWITFAGFAWQTDGLPLATQQTVIWLIIFVIVGWQEELLSRGYQLQNISDGINLLWGVLISSFIFGGLHLFNPGATWVSTLGIFLAGLFLALGYVLTRQLWLSLGLHIGWNLFEGTVFGFPVSGLNPYALLHIRVSGPVLWTGGEFGPEAGLVVLPALLIGAILVYLYSKNIRREKHD